MTAQLAAYGRLGGDPVERTAQSGKTWATASLAVNGGDDKPTLWVSVVAFDRAAQDLCRHAKGDHVSVSGRLQLNKWNDHEGKEREQLQVVVDALVSARSVRPAGGRRHDNDTGRAGSRPDRRDISGGAR